MDIQDSAKVFYYIPILTVVLSGAFSYAIARFTAKSTQRAVIKKMFIDIESGNYRVLYEKKLAALKRIKEIQFIILENNSEQYYSVDRFMNEFPFKELLTSMHNLIIEYSYLFNEEVADSLKSIYHDTVFTNNNYDPESTDWIGYSDRIFKKFHNLVTLVSDDLKIDLKSIEKEIIKPSP